MYDSVIRSNGKLFVCADNNLLMNISEEAERFTYGASPHSDCLGEINESNPLLSLKWFEKNPLNTIEINTNLVGYLNFENVMSAICVGKHFGVSATDIKDALESYKPSNNRSQVIKTAKNISPELRSDKNFKNGYSTNNKAYFDGEHFVKNINPIFLQPQSNYGIAQLYAPIKKY